MAILNIISVPHPSLKKVASKIVTFDDELKKLAEDMIETMYEHDGVGLAGNQVNVLKRIIVVDCSEDRNQPLVLINPEFTAVSDEIQQANEGCLSVPEIVAGPISRLNSILVAAQNLRGEKIEFPAEAFFARCIQHEIDHLNGKVYIEYLSILKRSRILIKLKKNLSSNKSESQNDIEPKTYKPHKPHKPSKKRKSN